MAADKPTRTGDGTATAVDEQDQPFGIEDVIEDPTEDNPITDDAPKQPPESPPAEPDAEEAQPAGGEETPPETSVQPAEEAGDTDEASWTFDAAKYGLTDQHTVTQRLERCRTADEGVETLARDYAHLQGVLARQADELGRWRQAGAQTSPTSEGAPAQASQQPTNPPAAGGQRQQPQQSAAPFEGMSDEELAEAMETDPKGVLQKQTEYVQQQMRQHLDQTLDQRLASAQENVQTNVAVQQEFSAFTGQHPDWRQYWNGMEQVAEDLGFFPQYEDAFEAAQLRQEDQEAYATVLGLMAGGLPFADAKEFNDLRQQKAQLTETTQQQARKNASQRAQRAATGAGEPSARGTATAAEGVDVWRVDDMDPMDLMP